MENLEDLSLEVLERLTKIANEVQVILIEELNKTGIKYNMERATVRILNKETVGVQGDGGTYKFPAEIYLAPEDRKTFYELPDFMGYLSIQITNRVRDVNRVTLAIVN